MPTFDFECKSCKKSYEKLVLSSSESQKCPFCGSDNITKLFPTKAPSVRLKGEGWTGSKIMPIYKTGEE